MGAFFHGWRRKVGCVLLLASLALVAAWMRSQFKSDEYVFISYGRRFLVESGSGCFSIIDLGPVGFYGMYIGGIWQIGIMTVAAPLTLLSAYLILWKPRKIPAKPHVESAG